MESLINRVFTQRNLDSILIYGTSEINKEVLEKYKISYGDFTQKDAFINIYNYMNKKYRNEYFYKNQLLNKILIGRHSLNTTGALRELSVGLSIADFLLINEKIQVFEIKSGLDNLQRLRGQLTDYYKAFTYVNVIMDEKHLLKVKNALPYREAGLYVLTKRNTIEKVRESREKNNLLNHTVIFQMLRKKEYENILIKYYGELPQVDLFYYYDVCLKWFKRIPMGIIQEQLPATLKMRYFKRYKEKNSLILDFPPALREVIYFSNYSEKKINNFKSCLMNKI